MDVAHDRMVIGCFRMGASCFPQLASLPFICQFSRKLTPYGLYESGKKLRQTENFFLGVIFTT